MISFKDMYEAIETSKKNYEIIHIEWMKLVKEMETRLKVTPFESIFQDTHTRTIFRELLDKICDYEFVLFDKKVLVVSFLPY